MGSGMVAWVNVALRLEWGAEKMKAFIAKLSPQIGGVISCGEVARVSTGEFAILAMCPWDQFLREQAKGAPVAFTIPENGPTLSFWNMGVPRGSPHPNLAKLYINAVLSMEGQALLYQIDLSDLYGLDGSRTTVQLEDLRSKGITPLRVDAKLVAEHPEIKRLQAELRDIVRHTLTWLRKFRWKCNCCIKTNSHANTLKSGWQNKNAFRFDIVRRKGDRVFNRLDGG